MIKAVNVDRSVGDDIRAACVTDERERLRSRWVRQLPAVPFVLVESPDRSLIRPFVAYLDVLERTWPPDREPPTVVVVLPECIGRHWSDRFLRNQTARCLCSTLVGRDHTVILDVPYRGTDRAAATEGPAAATVEPADASDAPSTAPRGDGTPS